jgi:hypothetical protein
MLVPSSNNSVDGREVATQKMEYTLPLLLHWTPLRHRETRATPAGFLRLCAVEPALDDNEQPGKAESGQGTGYNPCVRIHYKQVQEWRRCRP